MNYGIWHEIILYYIVWYKIIFCMLSQENRSQTNRNIKSKETFFSVYGLSLWKLNVLHQRGSELFNRNVLRRFCKNFEDCHYLTRFCVLVAIGASFLEYDWGVLQISRILGGMNSQRELSRIDSVITMIRRLDTAGIFRYATLRPDGNNRFNESRRLVTRRSTYQFSRQWTRVPLYALPSVVL